MYINYRAVQLPVSKLFLSRKRGTGLCIPAVCERDWTYGALQQGFQVGRSGDERREPGATEAVSANTILR